MCCYRSDPVNIVPDLDPDPAGQKSPFPDPHPWIKITFYIHYRSHMSF